MAWVVVIGTLVAVLVIVVVLARQGNPADLSEQAGNDPGDEVTERPAGPGAEATGVADPGSPSVAPEREV
jgi:preprotein translocase subunit SecG